jgi:streptogramin lyase
MRHLKLSLLGAIALLAGCAGGRSAATPGSVLPAGQPRPGGASASVSPADFGSFYKDARPGGYPIAQIVQGPDGNLWFGDTSSIGRITPQGKQTKFAPNAAGGLIANGPSNALWFTSFDKLGNPAISRITTTGSIKNFPIPTKLFIVALARGPDGNEWFVDNGQDSIGKITPTGALTEYQLPDAHSHLPVAIASGPDGNVWFAAVDFSGHTPEVGKVTPGGTITEYRLARCTLDSDSIALGSDGNLWTSGFCSDKDAMISVTPAGSITVYPVAHSMTEMALGNDGRLWGRFAFYIVAFDTTAHVQSMAIKTPVLHHRKTQPFAVAPISNGAVWLTVNSFGGVAYVGVYHEH